MNSVKPMGLASDGANAGVKAVYKKALDSLIQKKTAVEDSHKAGYEASKKGVDAASKTDVEITATKKEAKQSLIDEGNKKPTANQISAEQAKLSEVNFRNTPEWVAQNIENKPKTSLTEEGLANILKSEKFAILTGENPKGKGQGEAQNKTANDKLLKYLKENGYVFHEVTGKYGAGENRILVENMSKSEARDIARIFDQHSVATKTGLVKSDGSVLDFKKKINRKKDSTDPDSDYYIAVKLADGTVVTFAMDSKGKGKGVDGKTKITSDEFFNTGSENPLVKEAKNRISDSDAIAMLEKAGTKTKGEKGENTAQQIQDKRTQAFNDAAILATQRKGGSTPVNKLPDMKPGTKAWEKMLQGVDNILRAAPEDGSPKTIETKPPTSKPYYPVDNKPKGPIRSALSKLNERLKGIRNNWLVTNPMGYSERGWDIRKRRDGPGEKAGDLVSAQGRMKRVREDELSRDALVLGVMLRDVRVDDSGKKIPKDLYKRHINEIDQYLRGNDDARVSFLTEAQKSQLDYARQRVDGLSEIFIEAMSSRKDLTKGERAFIEKVKNNQENLLDLKVLALIEKEIVKKEKT